MPTRLYIHSERTDTEQHRYRGEYELTHADYELAREVNHRGEIASEVFGGRIRVVMDGFGDETLFRWLFRTDIEENGEVVTSDAHERVIEKFEFAGASATGYRLHFDANTKSAVAVVLTIDAKEIKTDNDLTYKRR
jgi:hypothetical protein